MKILTTYAPIAVFAYNRPENIKKTMEKLNSVRLANLTEVFVFSDAAKGENDVARVEEVRNYLESFRKSKAQFGSLSIIQAERNNGLAKSIIDGVTRLLKAYGKVIVIEDDLIVSDDFLNYMNRALNYYEDKKKIWSISGYSFPMKALEEYPHDVFMAGRGCSWGWGTWIDRWDSVDWDVSDYNAIKFNLKKRYKFGRWGQDQPFMLDANHYGRNHSWAIRWCYSQHKQDKWTVYPKYSRVINTGTDGSGTNYKKKITKYDTALYSDNHECCFEMLTLEENIRKEFCRKYMHPLAVIRAHYKWLIIKLRYKK